MPKQVISNDREIKDLFTDFLKKKFVSSVTIKNYLSDLWHFKNWLLAKLPDSSNPPEFCQAAAYLQSSTAHEYKSFLIREKVAVKTINRHLTTIRRLAEFLLEKEILTYNFARSLTNISGHFKQETYFHLTLNEEFKSDLAKQRLPEEEIEGCVGDLKHFFYWLEKQKN